MESIKRVLIIDDDEASVFLTRRTVSSLGYVEAILVANSGFEGLKLLKDAKEKNQLPQLILLDVQMHAMDGFAFLEELSKLSYVNMIDTRIVMLSATRNPLEIEAAKRHLAAEFVVKPLTKEKLLNLIG